MPSSATTAWLAVLCLASGCGDRSALGETVRASQDAGVDAFDTSESGVRRCTPCVGCMSHICGACVK